MPRSRSSCIALFTPLFATLLVTLLPRAAAAHVRLEGDWSGDVPSVSFEVRDGSREEALHKLAAAAGWSLVMHGISTDHVDVVVRDEPPAKVLAMLLVDGDYVARRDGGRLSIEPAAAQQAPPEPATAAKPESEARAALGPADATAREPSARASGRGDRDRWASGGHLRIEPEEVVEDVVAFGADVDVFGTAEGDMVAVGGHVRVHPGAHVHGDATAIGGTLRVDEGARVDGDVDVIGGRLLQASGARIGGRVVENASQRGGVPASTSVFGEADEDDLETGFSGLVTAMRGAVHRTALLFLLGAIFLALAPTRSEMLEVEIARRPMRSLALGVVGWLSALVLAIALCVTVVGIPFAVAGSLVAIALTTAGACAVLTTAGQALLRHRTRNRYVHLAVGCVLLLLVQAIPIVGSLAGVAVALMGMGVLVATRGAGLLPPRPSHADRGPYRTAAV
ncbi:MAG: hypothetical protein MUF54_00860 [Polyangiaceae bacterium]|nr:hypothetical protein [Polyangiaceae bacterium]